MNVTSSSHAAVRLPALHAGQQKLEQAFVVSGARYRTAACGRRFGKSVFAQRLLSRAVCHGLPAAYFAQSYKLLEDTWRSMVGILAPGIVSSSRVEHRVEMLGGGILEGWTLDDRDAGRSRKYGLVIIDEAGLCPHLGETWNNAIRPTLSDLEGGAWFLGTPKGRGYFYEMFMRGADAERPEYFAYRATTHDNPHIKPAEIEAMRQSMTDRAYRQEILAEFLEDGGGVFRFVREAATSSPLAAGEPGHQYAIGVDWGRENDATVYAVFDVAERRMVALDRMLRTDYALQRTRLHALASAFGRPTILAEANSMGAPVIEQLQREGLHVVPFVTSNATKAQIVDALALGLERREVALLNDPVLIAELEAFESQRLPSGMLRYGAPEGQHDDCVMAVCLAFWQVTGAGRWTGGNL